MQQARLPKRNGVNILKREKGLKEKDTIESDPRDTIIKENPMNESTITQEMLMAERRATGIRAEIKKLKKILVNFCNKDELSEEDRLMLKDTQATVISKVRELNEITHMLQRTIGLCEPSAQNMFQLLRLGLN